MSLCCDCERNKDHAASKAAVLKAFCAKRPFDTAQAKKDLKPFPVQLWNLRSASAGGRKIRDPLLIGDFRKKSGCVRARGVAERGWRRRQRGSEAVGNCHRTGVRSKRGPPCARRGEAVPRTRSARGGGGAPHGAVVPARCGDSDAAARI